MFVGEAPGLKGAGATGIPFFTLRNEQSANRFAKLMSALGADCDQEQGWQGHGVFVTDVVLRNPVERGNGGGLKNRGLTALEVRESLGLLGRQVDVIRPRVIVALGRKACQALSKLYPCPLDIDGVFHQPRGKTFKLVGCPHPSPHNNARKEMLALQETVFGQLRKMLS
jgi:uracil-DNA glycosylase family 4